jgi:hypothetical protein
MEQLLSNLPALLKTPAGTPILGAVVMILLRLWSIKTLRERVFGWLAKLPSDWKWVAPAALSVVVVGLTGYQSGARGWTLVHVVLGSSGLVTLAAIGWHHLAKRLPAALVSTLVAAWKFVRKSPDIATILTVCMLGALALSLTSCAGSLETSRQHGVQLHLVGAAPTPQGRCDSLDSQHRWGSTIATGSALVAGGAGLSTIRVDDRDRQLRYGLAIGSIGFAALAAGAEWYSTDAARHWAQECSR